MHIDLSKTYDIGGFLASCLVDSSTGLMLASEGGGRLDLEAVAALNTNFLKAKLTAIEALGLNDEVEDILITLGKQVHFIRPIEKARGAFLYVALEKKAANIGMARIQVRKIENSLSF